MNLQKKLLLWFLLGCTYTLIEVFWRGYTHIAMFLVGGTCGILIGLINQTPIFYNTKIVIQSFLGTFIVLFVEFISGYILNIILKLNIWDYTNLPFNIMGQICLLYSFLWFFLMPFAIWIEDTFQWILYDWYKRVNTHCNCKAPSIAPYKLKTVYMEFFTFK